MMRRNLRIVSGGKMTEDERRAKLAMLSSHAKDLDCLRNELRQVKPREACNFSDESLRALARIKKKFERLIDD